MSVAPMMDGADNNKKPNKINMLFLYFLPCSKNVAPAKRCFLPFAGLL